MQITVGEDKLAKLCALSYRRDEGYRDCDVCTGNTTVAGKPEQGSGLQARVSRLVFTAGDSGAAAKHDSNFRETMISKFRRLTTEVRSVVRKWH
jgi:hypothetical protein